MPFLMLMLLFIVAIAIAIFIGTVGFIYIAFKGTMKLINISTPSLPPRSIRKSLKDARHYGNLILKTVEQHPPGILRSRLELTTKPVSEWLTSLDELEQNLTKLYGQRNCSRELRQLSFEIDDLRRQLLAEDEKEAVYIRKLIESKKQHKIAVEGLQKFQTQAELKIRKIASDLGTTHAEILLIITRGNFNESRMRRLDRELQEQVENVRDILSVMDEVGYSQASN